MFSRINQSSSTTRTVTTFSGSFCKGTRSTRPQVPQECNSTGRESVPNRMSETVQLQILGNCASGVFRARFGLIRTVRLTFRALARVRRDAAYPIPYKLQVAIALPKPYVTLIID